MSACGRGLQSKGRGRAGEAPGRGGAFLRIRKAAGPGRGAEDEGRSPAPRKESSREPSRLARVHPAPSPGPGPWPASDRAAAAATAAAAVGELDPARAAGGGGARALDVPQRGGQREKGGRRGLGSRAAPLLMWRRVGGGCGSRMERGCQGWRGWSWVGVQEQAQQAKDRETGVLGTDPCAISCQVPGNRNPGHKMKDRGAEILSTTGTE
ncbi:hypothetical protein P7K49_034408 [Saguinus oedipus]|uniref:Uncharacterized protein n=1 Tax=Saguinus oedipus TaxID=9490 RepID=A0ABQ9TUM2_SAGOE|nr:hypothetical protein P7K49_034408 [Saguinus oedipus]